jgi:hypothetical protein
LLFASLAFFSHKPVKSHTKVIQGFFCENDKKSTFLKARDFVFADSKNNCHCLKNFGDYDSLIFDERGNGQKIFSGNESSFGPTKGLRMISAKARHRLRSIIAFMLRIIGIATADGQSSAKLVKISGCDNPNRVLDVVLMHGLDGDALKTWHPSDKPDCFWPKWLGDELPNVGIWSVTLPLFGGVTASGW